MAIAHRATSSAAATLATDDGVSPAVPTGTTDGDVLFAWVSTAANVAITPPAGWTKLADFTGGGNTIYFGFKVASSEAGTYAFTWTDSRGTGIVSAYSGVDNTNPVITWRAHNTTTSATSQTVSDLSSIATDPSVSMLLTFLSLDRGATTTTQPTGYTLPANGNPDSGTTTANGVESGVAYKAYTGGSGIAATNWTTTNNAAWTTVHLAMRESGDTQAVMAVWPGVPTTGISASLAVTMPLNHKTGDLLICLVAWKGDSNTASMSGWTQKGTTVTLVVGGDDDNNLATFYKYATSSSESGTVTLGTSKDIAVVPVLIKRPGTAGDPFADYQTVIDSTSNTTSDFPALTVTAQDMVAIAAIHRRGDQAPTAGPSGYAAWATPNGVLPLYARSSAASSAAMVAAGVLFQTTANPASGQFTHGGSAESVGLQGAVALNDIAAVGNRRLFWATILG